jgi:hypothetical protein
LGLPIGLFPSGFPTETLCTSLLSPNALHAGWLTTNTNYYRGSQFHYLSKPNYQITVTLHTVSA